MGSVANWLLNFLCVYGAGKSKSTFSSEILRRHLDASAEKNICLDIFLSLWPEFPEEGAWSPMGGSAREPRFHRGQ